MCETRQTVAMEPVAVTRSGNVSGTVLPADASHLIETARFLGIPFAQPISGERRFAPPQRETPWEGLRRCDAVGPTCPQIPNSLEGMLGARRPNPGDDCLTVNVWTPADALGSGSLPVMVWIHGGAFETGSGSTPWYDGQRFAANQRVVLITLNYRLGALGYLDLSRVIPESEGLFSPNNGMADQVAALEWVQESVAGFGGDPGNVTVFGESAGAMSIGALLGAPSAKGLFRRAILQSGACANVSSPERADMIAKAFLDALHLPTDSNALSALTILPMEELIEATQVVSQTSLGVGGLAWQPTYGTSSLPQEPLAHVSEGCGVDVLLGTTREEMRMFLAFDQRNASLDRDAMVTRLTTTFDGTLAEAIVDGYVADGVDANGAAASALDTWTAITTDQVFRRPAHQLARALRTGGAPSVWMYEFAWATPAFGGVLGSCHALEIPFVFDNLGQVGVDVFTGTGEERQAIANTAHRAWASFATHGDPNQKVKGDVPYWPQWDDETAPTFILDATPSLALGPRGDVLRNWPT
jgi:para-nitrobenzyl esterase